VDRNTNNGDETMTQQTDNTDLSRPTLNDLMTKHDERMMQSAIADTIYRETGEYTLNTTLDAIIQTIKACIDRVEPGDRRRQGD